jgi:polar amino acid transport system permease protein
MGYDWDFRLFVPYLHAFLRGIWVTIQLAVISSVAGTVLGFALAPILRTRFVGPVLSVLNDAARAVPILVLMLFFYYFPYVQVLGVEPPSAFVSAAAALTLAQINFTAEVVRGAIDGVSQKSILGARSLGLKEITIWRYVVIPDVIRQVLPTLVAFYIGNVKLSSLASVIGAEDVVFVARLAVSQTFRSLEAWVIVAAIYIALVLPLTVAARRLERSEWLLRRS